MLRHVLGDADVLQRAAQLSHDMGLQERDHRGLPRRVRGGVRAATCTRSSSSGSTASTTRSTDTCWIGCTRRRQVRRHADARADADVAALHHAGRHHGDDVIGRRQLRRARTRLASQTVVLACERHAERRSDRQGQLDPERASSRRCRIRRSSVKLLVVNGVDWSKLRHRDHERLHRSRVHGRTTRIDFWDTFPAPASGYPSGVPARRADTAPCPADTIGHYRNVIWVGNDFHGDLALWQRHADPVVLERRWERAADGALRRPVPRRGA